MSSTLFLLLMGAFLTNIVIACPATMCTACSTCATKCPTLAEEFKDPTQLIVKAQLISQLHSGAYSGVINGTYSDNSGSGAIFEILAPSPGDQCAVHFALKTDYVMSIDWHKAAKVEPECFYIAFDATSYFKEFKLLTAAEKELLAKHPPKPPLQRNAAAEPPNVLRDSEK